MTNKCPCLFKMYFPSIYFYYRTLTNKFKKDLKLKLRKLPRSPLRIVYYTFCVFNYLYSWKTQANF